MLRLCTSLAFTLVLLVAATRADEIRSAGDSSSQVLEQKVSLGFENDSLDTVAKTIAREAGANLVIDVAGFEDAGIDPDKPAVSIQLQGIRLKDVLDVILKPHGLTWTFSDSVIKITGPDGANPLVAETYSVVDLVARRSVAEGENAIDREALQQIADFLQASIAPKSWLEAGGQGTVVVSEQTASLIVRQTAGTHGQLRDVLDQMRRMSDLRIVAELKVIRVPAGDLLRTDDALLTPRTLSDAEQSAWSRGQHRWSEAAVLEWANVTLPDGEQFQMRGDTFMSSVTYRTTVSQDRASVMVEVEDSGNDVSTTVSIPDGKMAMIPLCRGRIPVIEDGSAFVVVIAPSIKVLEEEEELLSTLRR